MERQHGHSGIEKKGSRGTKGNWNREDSGEKGTERKGWSKGGVFSGSSGSPHNRDIGQGTVHYCNNG